MYDNSFRLRGKTYDYKIPYDNIKKFMLMAKPDDVHQLISIGLEPPLRQGQTRYPFLVMQFKTDEERSIDLNITEYVPSSQTCLAFSMYSGFAVHDGVECLNHKPFVAL
jgi:structure-specific recognition protein 1